MESVFRIIRNQFELNDSLDSYEYHSYIGKTTYTDKYGTYKIKKIIQEKPCSCHPETCSHFDGKISVSSSEKIYLKCEHKEIFVDGSWHRCKNCNEIID